MWVVVFCYLPTPGGLLLLKGFQHLLSDVGELGIYRRFPKHIFRKGLRSEHEKIRQSLSKDGWND